LKAALADLEQRPRRKLLALALVAVGLSLVPGLNLLLEWFETFFHELSHGLVALASGGRILGIELEWNGAGQIRYAGSFAPALVTFAGYPGAVVWGVALYVAAASRRAQARHIALALAALIAVCALLWMRDLASLTIAAVLIAMLVGLWRFTDRLWGRLLLELIAVYLMIAAVKSIWSMLGLSGRGDAEILSDLTWLPAFVFPPIWLACGAAALWWLWRREERRRR